MAKDLDSHELLSAPPGSLNRLIERVGGIPLALKLAAHKVSAGNSLDTYLDRLESGLAQQDILEFCFAESWGSLNEESRHLAMAVAMFSEPPSLEELRQITKLPDLRIREGLACLTQYAFANPFTDSRGQTSRYALLPLTADFVRKRTEEDPSYETVLRDNFNIYLVEVGRYNEALSQIAAIAGPSDGIPEKQRLSNMLVDAAFRAYQGGHYQDAVTRLDTAKSYMETAFLYYTWGILERDEGHFSAARENFRKASSLDQKHLSCWRSWGRMEQRLGNWENAVACFSTAVTLEGSDPQDYHGLGLSLARLAALRSHQGDPQSLVARAEQEFRKGFYRDPIGYRERHHNVVNHHALAVNLARLGRKPEAATQVREGLRLEPGNERLIDLQLSLGGG
ncbi:MAG: hypothetical protein HY681_12345 [Chloroflexi bacterium]|nr:hypothetical protein [Chloroflexota bacterium]